MGRSVRVLLRNGDEKTFENAAFQADFGTRVLTVYRKVEDEEESQESSHESPNDDEREELARFSIDTVRFYEYFIDE
jgi:hypothetical protein